MTPLLVLPVAAALVADTPAIEASPPLAPPQAEIAGHSIAPALGDPATEILDLAQERNRRLTVPVAIDGAGPFRFMIDTGSQATAITYQINQTLSLPTIGMATLVGMASRRPVEMVEISAMTFGSNTIYDLVSPVLDRDNVGADGILGLDSLQNFRVMLDFREETIALEDVSQKRGSQRGFEIIVRAREELGQLLITNAMIEGVRATVIIDTGAQSSIANTALKDRLRNKRAQEVTTTDVNGVSMIGDLSIVRSLAIEGMALRNVPLTFADAPAFEALGLKDTPVIALGMDHLRMFDRVAIDFAERRVLFDVPRDVARAMRRNRTRGGMRVPLR